MFSIFKKNEYLYTDEYYEEKTTDENKFKNLFNKKQKNKHIDDNYQEEPKNFKSSMFSNFNPNKKEEKKNSNNILKSIFIKPLIILVIILILVTIVIIDIYRVSTSDKKPLFAIETKTHDDGGTKEYLGLFYKVIKYNQDDGKKSNEVGFWTLNYDTTPVKIDFNKVNKESELKELYNTYIEFTSPIKYLGIEDKSFVFEYEVENNKYLVYCQLYDLDINISDFAVDQEIKLTGVVSEYSDSELLINNCNLK